MRSSADRTEKYGAKVSGETAGGRVDAYRKKQASNFAGSAVGQVETERTVKLVLTKNGVSPRLNHYYMDFGKELVKVANRYKGDTQTAEIEILQNKWFSRGLDVVILDEIKNNIIKWTGQPFIMDFSLLDGGDVLS